MSICNYKSENIQNQCMKNDDSKDRSLTEQDFSNSWKYALEDEIYTSHQNKVIDLKHENLSGDCDKNYLVNNRKCDLNSKGFKHAPSYTDDISNTFYSVVGQNNNYDHNHNKSIVNKLANKSRDDSLHNIKLREGSKTIKRNKKSNEQDFYWDEATPNVNVLKKNCSSHISKKSKQYSTQAEPFIEHNGLLLSKAGSKSMNDINRISALDCSDLTDSVYDEDFLFLEKDLAYSDELSLLSFPGSEASKNKISLNNCLKESNFNEPSINNSHGKLYKRKSHSLSNLPLYKTPNYSQVQSKVKKYIQKCKRQEFKESKSLPVTPIKGKRETQDGNLHLFDENLLESLSIPNKNFQLPEDLERIEKEIANGNSTPELLEELFEKLKRERQSCINQHVTLNAMQLHYGKLLLKYAQARNTIDMLRFYKEFHDRNKKDSQGGGANSSKKSNFKKALSTSNIFNACSGTSKPCSNLVRYPSSPIIDPACTLYHKTEEGNLDISHYNQEKSSKNFSFTVNSTLNDYVHKCEYLQEKIKEYLILEARKALKEEERDLIWSFILEKHSELILQYESFNEDTASEYGFRKTLEDINQAIHVISSKVSALQCSAKIPSMENRNNSDTLYDASLPVNLPYPSTFKYPNADNLSFGSFSNLLSQNALKNKEHSALLKHSLPKDADSGCPPSDRSTKNSHYPSFEQTESLVTNSKLETKASHADCDNSKYFYEGMLKNEEFSHAENINRLLNVSSINLGIEDYALKKETFFHKGLPSFCLKSYIDEDYDASDESFEDQNTKKMTKKRNHKAYKVHSDKTLNKFEDRFVCEHRFNTVPTSEKLPVNKTSYIDLSQNEMNSKYFQNQMKNLKSKGLNKRRDKSYRLSLPNRPVTPWKVVIKESESSTSSSNVNRPTSPNWGRNESVAGKGSHSARSSYNKYKNSSQRPLSSLGDRDGNYQYKNANTSAYIENLFLNKKLGVQIEGKFSTSTPKSKDIEKSINSSSFHSPVVKAKESNCEFQKRSQSLPSLQNGVEDSRTEAELSHQRFLSTKIRTTSRILQKSYPHDFQHNRSRGDSHKYEVAHSNLIVPLDAATSLAEEVRSKSQNMLSFFRTDLFPLQS